MTLIFQEWITRKDLRENPDKRYVFGDNVERRGYGGQAKEMRGEPNAIGVVTKWAPRRVNLFSHPYTRARALMARQWSARCYGVARQREGSRQNSIGHTPRGGSFRR
jgi:hypothetical protein